MNRTNDREPGGNRIPENDPSKAMDSKREVEQSNDEKTDQDFPGYPHYPAKEDIMDQRTDSHRVDVDVENLPANRNATGVSQRFAAGGRTNSEEASQSGQQTGDDDLGIQMGTEADVTEDDLALLDSTDPEIGLPQNVSNEDLDSGLDIPGSDLDEESSDSIGRDQGDDE